MINGWTILHLPKRVEREAMSLANAERLGVPDKIIRFWDAIDAADFKDADEIREAAVADGFPEFRKSYGNKESPLGRHCQIWNICRFLRDLANRDSIEMFIHDGMMIGCLGVGSEYYIDFQWLCEAVELATAASIERNTVFKLLILGHQNEGEPIDLIYPTSVITYGIRSNANSIRVYSSEGAGNVLHRILEDEFCYRNSSPDHVFFEKTDKRNHILWQLDGAFTVIISNAFDMPRHLLGSDSVNWESHQGVYADLFKEMRL